jgi:dienelactone hydrolase
MPVITVTGVFNSIALSLSVMIPRLFCLFVFSCLSALAADPLTLKLWPEGAPGVMLPPSKSTQEFIRTKAGKSTITNIADPTITVYRPEKPNGTTVIIAPGGGYVFLSAVHEGTQVCEWLNSIGVTAVLLKYRTPTRDEAAPHEKPVQDALKAMTIVRDHAQEWNINPNRVGLLGFSAGGNLLAHVACDRPAVSGLPNFGIMIYGGGFVDFKEPTKLKVGFTVPADAPPLFMTCAGDDGQNPLAAAALYLEYKKQNLPAELHLFSKGGHGFGMRDNKQPINAWPTRCAEWMDAMGW